MLLTDDGSLKHAIENLEFIECDTCRYKTGSPVLCQGCLINRLTIGRLKNQIKAFQLEKEFVEALRDLKRYKPQGPVDLIQQAYVHLLTNHEWNRMSVEGQQLLSRMRDYIADELGLEAQAVQEDAEGKANKYILERETARQKAGLPSNYQIEGFEVHGVIDPGLASQGRADQESPPDR